MVDEGAGTQFVATHEVPLGGEQPVLLHGGALLGVVLNKPAAMGACGRFLCFSCVGVESSCPRGAAGGYLCASS